MSTGENKRPGQNEEPAALSQSGGVNINAQGDVNLALGSKIVGRDEITHIHHHHGEARPEPKFLVPFLRNDHFVGRDDELERVHVALQKGETVSVRPAMLSGLGGIGKTQLAVEYAYRFKEAYSGGVYWINAAQEWQIDLAARAEEVGLRADDAPESDRRRRLVLAFKDFLDQHPDALLIFDNVEDPRLLNTPAPGFVPSQLKCRVIFTTRRRDDSKKFATIEVKVLPPSAALELLLSSRPSLQSLVRGFPITDNPEVDAAQSICKSLGYLPLALTLAVAYLKKYPKITLSSYRKRLEKEGGLATVDAAGVDALDLSTRHDAAVAATLKSQWDALESEDARRVLQTAALLGEAAQIPRARLSLLTGLADEADDGYAAPLDVALRVLSEFSLVEELTEHEIRLHPLVRQFAISTIYNRPLFAEMCAMRMADALWKMARLHSEVAKRGIDAVLSDLHSALDILFEKQYTPLLNASRLTYLLRPLDLEAHNLRRWNPRSQPSFFLQQLRNRCLDWGFDDLRQLAETQLHILKLPYLRERFRTSHESKALIRTLTGHRGLVKSLAITPDGRLLVSASYDGTLRVWDVATGEAIRVLKGHSGTVNSVAVSPDGQLAISASSDETIGIWNLSTGQSVGSLQRHSRGVRGVSITPDGHHIISTSWDGTLRVWNLVLQRDF